MVVLLSMLVACSKKNDYPAEAVTEFMNSCGVSSGGNTEFCSCAIDKIQKEFAYEAFKKIDTEMTLGDKSAVSKLSGAISQCRK
jgi:hypothetical protein